MAQRQGNTMRTAEFKQRPDVVYADKIADSRSIAAQLRQRAALAAKQWQKPGADTAFI